MLDELLSGFVGSTLSELLQKVAPPRQFAELSGADFETLTRRNQHLYVLCGCAGWLGFVSSFLYAISDWRHDVWQIGLVVGLPSTGMFSVLVLLGILKGLERVREYLRYYELKSS